MGHGLHRDTLKRQSLSFLQMAILAVLAWMARGRFYSGDYLYYFGVIGGSLLIIALLFLVLRKRDRLRRAREEDQYTTYAEDNAQDSAQ